MSHIAVWKAEVYEKDELTLQLLEADLWSKQ